MRWEGREPLPDHAGESTLLSRSGGEKGLRGSSAGTLGVPLRGTRRVGGLLGVAGRLSGTVSPFRAEQGMLKLKLQYFGHLMRRVDSLEKTLMLGGIGGRTRRGRQRMRWLDGITDSMHMGLGELREL